MARRAGPAKPKRRARNSGSVFVRRDGRIGAVLPSDLDPTRKPRYSPGNRIAFTSEAEAAAWLDQEIVRLRNPPPQGATTDEPLGDYLARWHRERTPLWGSARTIRAYRRSLYLAAVVGELGDVPLGQLTHELVRGALARLLTATWQRKRRDGTPTTEPRRYSRRTIRHARMVLGLALADLVPDVLQHNPVTRARLPGAQPPEQPVWDGDQADRFLQAAERLTPHLALAFRLVLRRALRRGEVLSLRWSDLDERRGTLTVERTTGERTGETGATKGRRRREIPLSADLLDRLSEHRNTFRHIFQRDRTVQSGPSPWVFPNPETGKPYHPRILSWWIPRLCESAGIPVCQPKDMRATCATVLLDQGWPLPRVAALLGHASVATTASHYARAIRGREERLARMADEIDALLDAGAESARAGAPQPIRRAE